MPKVRLVKGPFAGKVMEVSGLAGQTDVFIKGPKKLSRKQRYDLYAQQYKNPYHSVPRIPIVEARYTIAMANYMTPCTHPDGSYFYTYVEGSKREF
jgi:hypothetical protein